VEANAEVEIFIDGASQGAVTADGNGAWSFTVPGGSALADGGYTVTARQTDLAGNVSGLSGSLSLTVDTTAPAKPTAAPDLAAGSDTGFSNSDNITNDQTPTLQGLAGAVEGNATVEVFIDNGGGAVSIGTTTAAGDGSWSFTPGSNIAEGTYDVTVTATDAAGNTGPASDPLSIHIDLSVPLQPAAPDLVAGSDTGTSNSDDLTSDQTPTLLGAAGSAEGSAIVGVFVDGASIGTTTGICRWGQYRYHHGSRGRLLEFHPGCEYCRRGAQHHHHPDECGGQHQRRLCGAACHH